MLTTYAPAALWGVFLLASMVGWGRAFHRLLGLNRFAWPQQMATGIALSACLGGLFDLLGIISRLGMIGFLALGVLSLLLTRRKELDQVPPAAPPSRWTFLTGAAALGLGVVLAVRLLWSLAVLQPPAGMRLGSFHPRDDFQAYLVYPVKMLQTGAMGPEPFSLRRTPSHSYGGTAFLQALVLAALPAQSLRLLDVGLGTVLLIGLLWSYLSGLRVDRAAHVLVLLLVLGVPPPLGNLTSVIIPAALFVSLFLVFEAERQVPALGRAALIGLHVAAISVLKTSLIPAALGFLIAYAGLTLLRATTRSRVAGEALLWFGFAALAVLPWMLDAARWTGTFLPGSLSLYHAHPTRVAAFEQVTGWNTLLGHLAELRRIPFIMLALVAGVLLLRSRTRPPPLAYWSLLGAVAVGTVVITLSVGGAVNDLDRFLYPFLFPALVIGLGLLLREPTEQGPSGTKAEDALLAGAVSAALLFATSSQSIELHRFSLATIARIGRGERLSNPALQTKYRAMQSAAPAAARILARVDYPFLFDFRRNEVWIVDLPGSASLPPGMPFFQGGESLAAYLTGHGVRYVGYDYQSEARTPKTGPLAALLNDDDHPSARAVVRLIFDFHDNLVELGRTRQRVFDDGTAFLVDLNRPVRGRD